MQLSPSPHPFRSSPSLAHQRPGTPVPTHTLLPFRASMALLCRAQTLHTHAGFPDIPRLRVLTAKEENVTTQAHRHPKMGACTQGLGSATRTQSRSNLTIGEMSGLGASITWVIASSVLNFSCGHVVRGKNSTIFAVLLPGWGKKVDASQKN